MNKLIKQVPWMDTIPVFRLKPQDIKDMRKMFGGGTLRKNDNFNTLGIHSAADAANEIIRNLIK